MFEGSEIADRFGRDWDVHPDGDRFLMIETADETLEGEAPAAQIVMVENWFEELNRLVPTD